MPKSNNKKEVIKAVVEKHMHYIKRKKYKVNRRTERKTAKLEFHSSEKRREKNVKMKEK